MGNIPDGSLILHSCDNPRCVNPAHLRIGDFKQNVADMDERGRRNSNPKRGEENTNSILTDADVIAIRKAYIAGEKKATIASLHNMSILSVSDITSGRSWVHLLGVVGAPSLADLKAAKRVTPVTEALVRKIWHLHMSGKTVPEIVKITKQSLHSVEGIVQGKTWRHLHGAPHLDDLRTGGVRRGYNQYRDGCDTRSIHPKTKIPTSDIPSILERIEAGETLEAIGRSYDVKKTAIWRIKKAAAIALSHRDD